MSKQLQSKLAAVNDVKTQDLESSALNFYPQCHLQSQLGLDNININLSKLITCTLGALTPQHRHFIMIFQCLLCKNLKHDEHSRR